MIIINMFETTLFLNLDKRDMLFPVDRHVSEHIYAIKSNEVHSYPIRALACGDGDSLVFCVDL